MVAGKEVLNTPDSDGDEGLLLARPLAPDMGGEPTRGSLRLSVWGLLFPGHSLWPLMSAVVVVVSPRGGLPAPASPDDEDSLLGVREAASPGEVESDGMRPPVLTGLTFRLSLALESCCAFMAAEDAADVVVTIVFSFLFV